jgi:hypothetical protein
VANVVREALSEQLAPIADQLERLTERLAFLEEEVSRRARAEGPAGAAGAPSPTSLEAVRTRVRRRRGL